MSNIIHLKQGLDIPVAGAPSQKTKKVVLPEFVAIRPDSFRNLVPKLLVKEGDKVLAGTPVLADKMSLDIVFASPVSGTVAEVVRGDKRKLLEVRIKTDSEQESVDFGTKDVAKLSAEDVKKALLESGLWPAFIQRPYGILANPQVKPDAIFVSAFTTAPLAIDVEYSVAGQLADIQTGIDAIAKLTDGGVHVSYNKSNKELLKLKNVVAHSFEGKHPAGNVGIQIHNVRPIVKGDTVWTISMPMLAAIGKLFNTGKYNVNRIVAVTGPASVDPCCIETVPGVYMSDIKEFVNSKIANVRYVSGDLLSGKNVGKDGSLAFYDNQISLIKEGNEYEMFGWAKLCRSDLFSAGKTYLSCCRSGKTYDMDTNLHGGERAFVVSGIYNDVLPMHIFPVFLTKACMAKDIDKMERYGIYEVLEEDFALCEYVCPSKINIQAHISDGIELMLKEMA